MRRIRLRALIGALILAHLIAAPLPALGGGSDEELLGLWKANGRFGPDARGPLIIEKEGATYTADMVGRRLPIRLEKGELAFDLPDKQGSFRGKLEGKNTLGHWFRPGTPVSGAGASAPIALSLVSVKPDGAHRWRGTVDPLQDTFTFYLLVQQRPDGSLGAVLRNPEFDFGSQQGVERVVRDGQALKLIGKRGENEREVGTGGYDAERQVITLVFPGRGGSYDLRGVTQRLLSARQTAGPLYLPPTAGA
jgi:hypothetical protein